MVSERDVSTAIGSTAYGSDGESVGTVETFYTDDLTGATTWVTVSSGLLGRKQSIAPAQDATFADGRLQLAVPAGSVSSAPRLAGEHLSPEDEEALRRHYGQAGATTGDVAGRDVVDRDDGSMVRSEEQLRVGTEQVASRRMRVVKYVVTEEVQISVPIRREEIRIEEVPSDAPTTDGGVVTEGEPLQAAMPGGSATDGLPDEIVLHTERPVVTVEVVPVERVRLTTELVAGQTSVSEKVQREQVTVDQHPVPPRS